MNKPWFIIQEEEVGDPVLIGPFMDQDEAIEWWEQILIKTEDLDSWELYPRQPVQAINPIKASLAVDEAVKKAREEDELDESDEPSAQDSE